jgi:oxygen-independent coproporphyrinogen-3 oxidase
MALMCQGRVDIEAIESAHLIDFRAHFSQELNRLGELQEQGLVTIHAQDIEVTELGWFFVRAVAMVFDAHLQANRDRQGRFSRIL